MSEKGVLSESLQHPRRSQGKRYRRQDEKYLQLHNGDAEDLSEAGQHERKNKLTDF